MHAAAPLSALQRRFSVHGVGEAPASARIVEGLSFEDAALHFVDDERATGDAEEEMRLFVEDCATGERQCFQVDLATGDTAPCD